ncbi:MAG: hypothetical protein E6Q73_15710, partial [Pseudorhodobacter sp.]
VEGGQGHDQIYGGDGADLIRGDIRTCNPATYASGPGTTPTTASFTNASTLTVNVYWIDGSGTPQFYGTIAPGQTYSGGTYAEHNWMLTDAATGAYLTVYEGGLNQNVTFTNDFNDSIYGGQGADTIYTDFGNDLVYAGTKDDQIFGGAGHDTVYGGWGNENADLGAGNDSFGSWSDEGGNDTVYGGAGDDNIIGGGDNDLLYGGTGNDTLYGGAGSDSSYGGAGNDIGIITDDHNYDYYDLGEHAGDNDILAFGNYASTNGVNVSFSGIDQGSYAFAGGFATGNFLGVEGVSGTEYADTLNAGADSDGVTLWGNGGADSLVGGSGNDLVDGGVGNDTIYFGEGTDTAYGGAGDDLIDDLSGTAPVGASYVDAGDGNDTVWSGSGMDTVYAGAGDDQISAEVGNDLVYAGAGNDQVWGADGADTLVGGGGADWLYSGAGNDSVDAGSENDTIYLEDGDDGLLSGTGDDLAYGGSGNDTLYGEAGSDTLHGDGGADSLLGGTGADTLYGGDGVDMLKGGADNDRMEGGAGSDSFVIDEGDGNDTIVGGEDVGDFDILTFTGSTAGVSVLFTGAEAGSYTAPGGGSGTFSQIEGVSGTSRADTLDGSAASSAVTFWGGAGNDLIKGGAGGDHVNGDYGDDTVFGNAGNDTLNGDDGNDLLYGGTGDDWLLSGSGNDSAYGGSGNDLLNNLSGNALLEGGDGNDSLYGGDGEDTLRGGDGADSLLGGTGNDMLDYSDATTGVFVDISSGYTANGAAGDTISGFEGLTGSAQNDTLQGRGDADTILGGAGDDSIRARGGNDTVDAGAGNDLIEGNEGNDSLSGGDGNDSFDGGSGDDTLIGGAGSDTATFSGPVTDYAFDYLPGGGLQVSDLVAGRDGVDTLSGVEYVSFGGVTYRLVTGDDGSNTTLQGPTGEPALIIAHDGNDWGGGHATSDAIFGGAGNDTLDGGDGNDTLVGEADQDLLRGDGGNDALFGGTGNDTLQGGTGNDRLTGGAGADVYELVDLGGNDVVTDFDMGLSGGLTTDQLDVTALQNPDASPVKVWDVTVTDDGLGNALLTFPEGETLLLEGVSPATVQQPGMLAAMGVPCFAAGTRIATPKGPRRVENLAPGDMVMLADGGAAPVIWVGRRLLRAETLQANARLRPVRLRAGHHGLDRDLVLSSQHAVAVTVPGLGRALIRAGHLALLQWGAHMVRRPQDVIYHHLLLPRHALLRAHGASCESLYPGRMALSAFLPDQRASLLAALNGLHPLVPGLPLVTGYGPRCLPLLTFAQAEKWHAKRLDGSFAAENRFFPTGQFPSGNRISALLS